MPDIYLAPITRDNLDEYLKDLAKEFRRLNGRKTPAVIILVGGASVLANYNFRDTTCDVDAIIIASSAMKDAIRRVGEKHALPHGWLNVGFTRTGSYSNKLFEVSVFYKTFSNIVTIRAVTAEYLLAMKLISGRLYQSDISDIVGILREHQKRGRAISRVAIESAVESLYGSCATIPEKSRQLLDAIFENGDYEALYMHVCESESVSKELLLEFERNYANMLQSESINSIINSDRREHHAEQNEFMLASLKEKKRQA